MNKDKYIILGHENPDVDSIVSGYLLEKYMIKLGFDAQFVIPDKVIEKNTLNLCFKYGLKASNYQIVDFDFKDDYKYVLIDHSEREGLKNIFAIVDHHPRDKMIKCKNYYNYVSSSTSCIICKGREEYFDKDDIKLCILAAFVDTASFNSTKSVVEDKEWIEDLCEKYGFDYNVFYEDGLCLTDLDNIDDVCFNGLKKYNINELIVYSSFIHIKYDKKTSLLIKEVIKILKEYIKNNNIDIFLFIVHDMVNFKTRVYEIKRECTEEYNYERYTSRGGVIIPDLIRRVSS